MRAALVAMALVGCGGPSMTGTFTGTLADTVACDDGSFASGASNVSWDIIGRDGQLTVTTHGLCDPLLWRVDTPGDAVLLHKMCPPHVEGTVTRRFTFLNGSLGLSEPRLSVSFRGSDHVFNEASGVGFTCQVSAIGTLVREGSDS